MDRINRRLLWLVTVTMTTLVVIHLYVLERPVKSDEGGFLNPVLEYVHTGRVVYPAHGPDRAQSMIIHPPVHYWLTGLLMKAGLNFYSAAVTIVLVTWLILGCAILTARWPDLVKLSFLVGAYVPNLVLVDLDPSRSELQMALAWLAGLVLLENARLLEWEKWRLFAGSFLVSYASGLHYFALPATAGCVFYAGWIIREHGWSRGRILAAPVLAGTALFFVPYLTLFAIPEWRGILDLISALNAATGPREGVLGVVKAFQEHRQTYRDAYDYMVPSATEYKSAFLTVIKPFLIAGIPTVFIGTPLLLWRRDTRGLAIAALPFQLFLLFAFHHKSLPYYRGELSLFYAGVLAVTLTGVEFVLKRASPVAAHVWLPRVVLSAATVFVIVDTQAWQIPAGAVFVDELALARAAGKAVLGTNAIVGGRSVCLWYTSGGRYYRNFVSDLIYPPDLSHVDVRAYFDTFDAVAEEAAGSWLTYNKEKLGTPSWYVNGTLRLQGFYAGRRVRGSQYGYYLAGTRKKGPLQAYFWRGRQFFRFLENADGTSAVVAVVSPHGSAWTSMGPDGLYVLAVSLPPDQTDYVTFHVMSRGEALSTQAQPPAQATIRDVVFGDVTPADPQAMVKTVDYHREMTEIFYTTPELLATQVTTGTPQSLPLKNLLSDARAAVDGNSVLYASPPVTSPALLHSSMMQMPDGDPHVVSFRLKIDSGRLVINVVDPVSRSVLAQMVRYHAQPLLEERAFVVPSSSRQLQLTFSAYNDRPVATTFQVKAAQVAPVVSKKREFASYRTSTAQ